MGYRDDFYIQKNIIGYTGKLTSWPPVTIYFYDNVEYEFGRITQFDFAPNNIGRSLVRSDEKYLIFNLLERYPIQQTSFILNNDPIELSKQYEKNILAGCQERFDEGFDVNVLVECYSNDSQHFARLPFVAIMKGDCYVRISLSESINQFPDKKAKYEDD